MPNLGDCGQSRAALSSNPPNGYHACLHVRLCLAMCQERDTSYQGHPLQFRLPAWPLLQTGQLALPGTISNLVAFLICCYHQASLPTLLRSNDIGIAMLGLRDISSLSRPSIQTATPLSLWIVQTRIEVGNFHSKGFCHHLRYAPPCWTLDSLPLSDASGQVSPLLQD